MTASLEGCCEKFASLVETTGGHTTSMGWADHCGLKYLNEGRVRTWLNPANPHSLPSDGLKLVSAALQLADYAAIESERETSMEFERTRMECGGYADLVHEYWLQTFLQSQVFA